jgi:hypothetical protein
MTIARRLLSANSSQRRYESEMLNSAAAHGVTLALLLSTKSLLEGGAVVILSD